MKSATVNPHARSVTPGRHHQPSDSGDEDDELTLHFDDRPDLHEDFEAKVQKAQEQLLSLRRRQENLERQKSELEELSRKQERFVRGRNDLLERINRAIVALDRETHDTNCWLEQLQHTKDSFARHLSLLESLTPEEWSRADLRGELNHAISVIEDAEDEYARSIARLKASGRPLTSSGGDKPDGDDGGGLAALGIGNDARGFRFWLVSGLAFTVPLMMFLVVLVLLQALLKA